MLHASATPDGPKAHFKVRDGHTVRGLRVTNSLRVFLCIGRRLERGKPMSQDGCSDCVGQTEKKNCEKKLLCWEKYIKRLV